MNWDVGAQFVGFVGLIVCYEPIVNGVWKWTTHDVITWLGQGDSAMDWGCDAIPAAWGLICLGIVIVLISRVRNRFVGS